MVPPHLVRIRLVGVRPPAGVDARGRQQAAADPGLRARRQRDLAALMARLAGLVGPDNLGSPRLVDTHRPDSIALAPFSPPEGNDRQEAEAAPDRTSGLRLVLRRLRPAPRVDVHSRGERPVRVRWRESVCRVVGSAGPWRASGEWWDTRAWVRDEWDLLLDDGTLCRLARDSLTGQWTMDAIYD